jgi:hypothetical protein
MKDEIGWVIIYEYVDGVSVPTLIKNLGTKEGSNIRPYVDNGNIRIDGTEDFEVYNMQGMLISSNEMYVECEAGIYLVRINDTATKVIVK